MAAKKKAKKRKRSPVVEVTPRFTRAVARRAAWCDEQHDEFWKRKKVYRFDGAKLEKNIEAYGDLMLDMLAPIARAILDRGGMAEPYMTFVSAELHATFWKQTPDQRTHRQNALNQSYSETRKIVRALFEHDPALVMADLPGWRIVRPSGS